MLASLYSATAIIAASDDWFRHPTHSQSGPSISLLRQYIRPQAPAFRTLFISRVAHRKETVHLSRQRQSKYSVGAKYPRSFYTVSHYVYAICAIDWRSHETTILSEHDSKSAAIAALQQMLS